MKLIVGLGNPGIEYQFTPHNMGFLAVDRIAQQCGVRVSNRRCRALTGKAEFGGKEVLLAKPETFMNLSGMSVRALVEEFEDEPSRDLIVIHDELDLPHDPKWKFLTDANQPVAHIVSVKEEVAPTPEAVAEAAAATPAEPEVIKKGKQEVPEEGAEAEAAPAKPEKAEKKEKK